MKVLLVLATLISIATAAPVINEALHNDLNDFIEIIPIEKIKKIAIKHLHEDPEFQAAVQYMKSDEWKGMVEELRQQPEINELKEFLKEAGVDLDEYGAVMCKFFRNVTVQTDHKERSLKGFIDEVRQIIPLPKLIETFDDKMTNSPAFKEFYAKITSERAHQLVAKIRALPVFKKMSAEITLMGIDIERILNIVYAVFGWSDDKLTPIA